MLEIMQHRRPRTTSGKESWVFFLAAEGGLRVGSEWVYKVVCIFEEGLSKNPYQNGPYHGHGSSSAA